MPMYEFLCKSCREEFRTLRRYDELDSVRCPSCGTEKVARLLSVTAPARSEPSAPACPAGKGGCCDFPEGCCRN
jgi:putative FmdB family regulatory protein